MENKYQEALYTLTDWFHSYTIANCLVRKKRVDDKCQKAKETLQELIDNYAKLEEALDDACGRLAVHNLEGETLHWKATVLKDWSIIKKP